MRPLWEWFDSPNGRRSANAAGLIGFAILVAGGISDWTTKAGISMNWLPSMAFVAAVMILYGAGFYVLEFAYARRWLDRPSVRVGQKFEARLDVLRAAGVALRNEGLSPTLPDLDDWYRRLDAWSTETKEAIASKSRTSASFFYTVNRFQPVPLAGNYPPERRLELQVLEERLSRLQRFMRGDPL